LAVGANCRWCFTVQVICKDGTTIQCRDFEAIDSGVLFYQASPGRAEGEDEDEDEEEYESASGFVPITEVRFVLPDEMVQHRAASQRAGAPEGAAGGAPPGAPPQQGGTAQQQQMGGFPGQAGGQTPEHGRR
jgi:hypothetical protein